MDESLLPRRRPSVPQQRGEILNFPSNVPDEEEFIGGHVAEPDKTGGNGGAWQRARRAVAALSRRLCGPFFVFVRFPIARRRPLSVTGRILRLSAARVLKRSFVFTLLSPVRLHARFDFGSPILAYYLRLYEEASMTVLLRYLRKEEYLADVGANVGVYTVLAAGVVGARVHAFEPFSVAHDALAANTALNDLGDRVVLHRQALGAHTATAFITTTNKGANRIAAGGAQAALQQIDVGTLDDALGGDVPAAIKIDVEGYEEQVLLGAGRCLSSPKCNIVIFEAIDRASGHVGRCVSILTRFGFRPCTYDVASNRLVECPRNDLRLIGPNDENYLFVKDLERARQRIGQDAAA